ncbi:coenzyme F420-reducing hydrogenase, alpha subunit [Candidatus Omnitrophus magneticus]|uniref:Coenzyme F420-reducing hydrogenase, alpha subunit n=1 Tax=Candidatus Omnitrophus magneticus TaxID=1609969 RepID=A0A0F0CP22_9BACT|nr:coenzyme F420-reducing hydrogenase, alpha subunit [Candidatus Omnitrophus magneticus]
MANTALSKKELNINVEYLTRVEGHGNIVVNVKDGKLEKCQLEIIEAPRFFEAMVRGRSMFEVQHITSRICGICSTGHCMASIKATEDAIGFKVSEQTKLLRKLLLHLETLDSHILHAYFLVAPDALGVKSVVPLVVTHKEVVLMALRMKKNYSDMCDIMAGRHTHPISICPRGWTKLPSKKDLETMKEIFKNQLGDLSKTVDIFKTVKLPSFERETEYVSLTHPTEYAFYEGDITTSDIKTTISPRKYKEVIHEFHAEHSTAKHSKNKRGSYMAGALARINNNFDKLNEQAKGVARALNFKVPCYNPYMNTVAQLIEVAHCVYDSLRIIDLFLEKGINYAEEVTSWPTKDEWKNFKVTSGTGAGVVEVPRGILVHEYTINDKAIVESANCVIPTNQNLANIDLDMKKLIPEVIDKSKEEITLLSEMLVRAYDPCISCSVHMLKVDFVE